MKQTFRKTRPEASGLYEPDNERDACGVGFVAHIKGKRRTRSSKTPARC